mgnify:CR=1 FL=1
MESWNKEKVEQAKANLEGAELKGLDLSGANLKNANLISANLVSVNLSGAEDRKSTRLNSSHKPISYAVFCLKKKKQNKSCRR